MTANHIEPLEPHLWFAEVDKLLARQNRSDGQAPDALFRKAFYLVQLAPAPLREIFPCCIREATLETFLDCGAYAAAALALIGPPTGVRVARRTGSQLFEAEVALPDSRFVSDDVNEDPAKAMLGAWCKAVLMLRDDQRGKPSFGRQRTVCSPAGALPTQPVC